MLRVVSSGSKEASSEADFLHNNLWRKSERRKDEESNPKKLPRRRRETNGMRERKTKGNYQPKCLSSASNNKSFAPLFSKISANFIMLPSVSATGSLMRAPTASLSACKKTKEQGRRR